MSSFVILSISLLFHSCKSGCIPANTCFDIVTGNTLSYNDLSMYFTCNGGTVTKHEFEGSGCPGAPFSASSTTTLTEGDDVKSSSSGTIHSDVVQGVGCNQLTDPSEQCQDFMVLKHRGNRDASEGFYLDIGANCSAYIGNEQTFKKYSTVFAPLGCVDQFVGSKFFACDENGWSYTHYEDKGCPPGGKTLEPQSEDFLVDKCGYFSKWTHCNNGQESGCVNDGVFQEWWYWYDLECCPGVTGRTCCGAPSAGPTAINVGCQVTPRPTNAPNRPGTPNPTQGPVTATPTKAPTTKAPTTNAPTTKEPTYIGSPTKQPTTPGTAEPTAPTTAAPTDIFGTAKPTTPTTTPPTSPGTARPTNRVDGTVQPTTGSPSKQPTTPGTAKPTDIFGTAKPTAPTTAAPTSPGTVRPTGRVGGETTIEEDESNVTSTKSDMVPIIIIVVPILIVLIIAILLFYLKPCTKINNKENIKKSGDDDIVAQINQTNIRNNKIPHENDDDVVDLVNKIDIGGDNVAMAAAANNNVSNDNGLDGIKNNNEDENLIQIINRTSVANENDFAVGDSDDENVIGPGSQKNTLGMEVNALGEAEGVNYNYRVNENGAKQVKAWLGSIELDMYYDILIQNGFDTMESIQEMKQNDLNDIGITLRGHQLKLIKHIKLLN